MTFITTSFIFWVISIVEWTTVTAWSDWEIIIDTAVTTVISISFITSVSTKDTGVFIGLIKIFHTEFASSFFIVEIITINTVVIWWEFTLEIFIFKTHVVSV